MILDQARDWCAEQGVTILEDHEARRATLRLFGSDVSVSGPLSDDSLGAWQATFGRLVAKLRLRAELKERSRAPISAPWAQSSPQFSAPAGGARGEGAGGSAGGD